MTPQLVLEAKQRLTIAIGKDDEDAAAQAAIDLLCGAAFNLAVIAERTAPPEPSPPPT